MIIQIYMKLGMGTLWQRSIIIIISTIKLKTPEYDDGIRPKGINHKEL